MPQPIVERGTLMKVLDHGYVRIINFMGNDEEIVEAARMSNDKGFISWNHYVRCKNCTKVLYAPPDGHVVVPSDDCVTPVTRRSTGEVVGSATGKHDWEHFPHGDLGLLDNLWRKKHATPFEMGELVIEVQAPIMVFREWHRHRTQSYNEFSARYSVMPNIHYIPERERIQKQSTANKQGSAEQMDDDTSSQVRAELERQQQEIYDYYEGWCESGVAREVARINTPVSRYSKMRAKGNIRNWFQFLNLRMRPDAQYEIRQYANEVGKILSWLWPKAYSFFEEYDLYGAHFSRTELKALRTILMKANVVEQVELMKVFEEHGLKGTKLKEFQEKLREGGDKILS